MRTPRKTIGPGSGPGGEDALFVEDAVIRQIDLEAHGLDPAAVEQGVGIVALAVLDPGQADEHGRAAIGGVARAQFLEARGRPPGRPASAPDPRADSRRGTARRRRRDRRRMPPPRRARARIAATLPAMSPTVQPIWARPMTSGRRRSCGTGRQAYRQQVQTCAILPLDTRRRTGRKSPSRAAPYRFLLDMASMDAFARETPPRGPGCFT